MTTIINDDSTRAETRDALEARARRLMAQRAATPATWQFRKQRTALAVEINETLDEWLAT